MLDNATAPAEFTHNRLLSEHLAQKIYQSFYYVVIPCISLLGIVGNVSSFVTLTRQGFSKCSNILLLALTLSNILLEIGINNCPHYMCYRNGYFLFSETINYMCYILSMVFFCAYTIGVYTSVLIPVLITSERILSIFCPFKAKFILTPRRTIVVISCVYITTGMFYLYRYILSIQFRKVLVHGVTKSTLVYTDLYLKAARSGANDIVESVVNYVTGIIPISLVTIGCLVVGLKILQITKKRRQLTSCQVKLITKRSTLKTTKTLLIICVLYIVCNGFGFASISLSQMKSLEREDALQRVILYMGDVLVCLNCVGDFLIYSRANNRLRRKSTSVSSRLREGQNGVFPKT